MSLVRRLDGRRAKTTGLDTMVSSAWRGRSQWLARLFKRQSRRHPYAQACPRPWPIGSPTSSDKQPWAAAPLLLEVAGRRLDVQE